MSSEKPDLRPSPSLHPQRWRGICLLGLCIVLSPNLKAESADRSQCNYTHQSTDCHQVGAAYDPGPHLSRALAHSANTSVMTGFATIGFAASPLILLSGALHSTPVPLPDFGAVRSDCNPGKLACSEESASPTPNEALELTERVLVQPREQ